jgi:hypothetical protein
MTPSYTYTLKDAVVGSSGQVLSAGSGGSNGTYSINATSSTWTNTSTAAVIDAAGTMELRGKNADLIINGESLKDTLNEIKMALRIPNKLTRDPILEEEFDELKRAAEHYEKLKEKYLEQQKVWDTLKNKNLK